MLLVRSMSHRARASEVSDFDNREHLLWENPFTHEASTASFWDLYEGARARVLPLLDGLFAPQLTLEEARALTADLNFEGAPTAPDEKPAW